jgi:hypothetical protein
MSEKCQKELTAYTTCLAQAPQTCCQGDQPCPDACDRPCADGCGSEAVTFTTCWANAAK